MSCLRSPTTAAMRFGLAIALLCAFATIHAVHALPATSDGLNSAKLMNMIEAFKSRRALEPEDALAAYNEYVDLHHQQSDLASRFDKTKSEVDELSYEQIGDILAKPELLLINLNIFSVIPTGSSTVTPALSAKLETAMRELGLKRR